MKIDIKNIWLSWLFVISSVFILSSAKAQNLDDKKQYELHLQKGYLLFIISKMDEELVFLPDDNANKKYSFNNLQKLKGGLLRGNDTYEIYKAKQKAKKFNVLEPIFHRKDSTFSDMPIQLGVLAVEITYRQLLPGKNKEDSGIPFDYQGRRYVINYIDDWDIVVEKIKPLH